jgi:hypothetical protein
MNRHDLDLSTLALPGPLLACFGLFLLYPVCFMPRRAFASDGRFTFECFGLLLASPLHLEALSLCPIMFLNVSAATISQAPDSGGRSDRH